MSQEKYMKLRGVYLFEKLEKGLVSSLEWFVAGIIIQVLTESG